MMQNEMVEDAPALPAQRRNIPRVARQILTAFLFTFIAARIVVFLIMSRRMPDLYLYVGGNHVHHLNYGIFLLSAVGAYFLLAQPTGKMLTTVTFAYGIGLGLTFDEFGMWVHLGGAYWQRASFDAVVVIAAVFGLIGAAPAIRKFRGIHWVTAMLLLIALVVFGILLEDSLQYASRRIAPALKNMETRAPQ